MTKILNGNFICVDVGGTNLRVAKASSLEQPEFSGGILRTTVTHNYKNDLKWIIDSALNLSVQIPITALGIGMPGRMNDKKTMMVGSNNLPEWRDQDSVRALGSALSCPVFVDNDGIAAGLGEAYFGQQPNQFDYLIWATGISAIRIEHASNGQINATYLRPQFHDFFEKWEQDCAGVGIQKAFGVPANQLNPSQSQKFLHKFSLHFQRYLELVQPSSIVIGGGIGLANARYIEKLRESSPVPISTTQFGGNSGLVGALGLIRQSLGDTNSSQTTHNLV